MEERRQLLAAQKQRLDQEKRQAQETLASAALSDAHEQGLLSMAEQVRVGIEFLDFPAQRKVVDLLQIQVVVVGRRRVRVQALLPLGGHSGSAIADAQGQVVGYGVELDLDSGDAHSLHASNGQSLVSSVRKQKEAGA